MWKRTLIALAAMTTPALSADYLKPEDHAASLAKTELRGSITDWTGFRVGVHAGLTHTSADAFRGPVAGVLIPFDVANGLFPDHISADESSFAGGVDAGFDYQMGNFVIGIAGDATFSNIDVTHGFSRIDPNPNPPFSGVTTNTSYQTTIDYLATARLRVGYAFDKTLVYATGGVAVAEVENRFALNIPDIVLGPGLVGYTSPDWSQSDTQTGYVVGLGIEHQITDNWRLSFELQQVDLGDVMIQGTDPATFPGEEINYKFENKMLLARMGLAYAF